MGTKILVSCIIPTFNRREMVLEAVDSVLEQDYPELEILVIDDGSTDGTGEALSLFKDKLKVVRQENQGVSSARNLGVSLAGGEWIAFLDSDDLWRPQKISRQMAFLKDHPGILICQTEELWIRRGVPVNKRKIHQKPDGWAFAPSLKLCLISPSAVMLRKSLLDEIGGFDPRLPACEDYDLWLRLTRKFPVPLIREFLVVKRGGHADQLSHTVSYLDRFRIQSIVKLLESGTLNPEQKELAVQELKRKCTIYGQGCLKRGKSDLLAFAHHMGFT